MRRPGFIYAPDLDEYKRGFYYPLTDTPFPVTIDAEQFREAVLNFDEKKYAAGVEAFLEKMGCTDDGKSGGRIADFLETHSDFVLERSRLLLPSELHDGAYAALLRRKV